MWFKLFLRSLILLFAILQYLAFDQSSAQTSWSKYPGNPVLKRGSVGEFDAEQAKQPTVIFDNDVFKMWYVGRDNSHEQIGYAKSEDGYHWIKKGPVLPLGSPGEFDYIHQNTPKVLKIGADYHLWYSGFDGSFWRIGKAISSDGLSWKKQGVVLEKGNAGDFDVLYLSAPMILRLNSNYFLWYEGFDGNIWRIGFAISADGLIWQKQGLALDLGSANDFDWAGQAHPEVLAHDGLVHFWYSGFDGINWRIGYATSSIGETWQKYGVVLDVSAPGCFDSGDVADCSVIFDGTQYRMWYSGDVYRDWQIGYATEDTIGIALFTDVTQLAGLEGLWDAGLAFGDLNNDGYQDIYIGNRFGTNALFMNQVGSRFMNIASFAGVDYAGWTMGVSWADFNNDGNLDVYICNYNLPNILYKNKGDGIFKDITSSAGVGTDLSSYHAVWGDYNNDGFVDLYVVNFGNGQPNILYKNNGDETFTDATEFSGVGGDSEQMSRNAMWGDYDNDGLLDLFVVNQGQDVLYRNKGDGTFSNATSYAHVYDTGNGHGCAWADYDDDGFLDLYVTNRDQLSVLFKNNGDGTFTDVTSQSGLGVVKSAIGGSWADLDNDGDLDLYVTNIWGDPNYLFLNDGNGSFINVSLDDSGIHNYPTTNATFGDYNNDGAIDLITTLSTDGVLGPCLYRNQGNSNHWLIVNLIGSISNRSAIGARARLVAGKRAKYREVNGGCGNFTFDSLPVEFGLRQATIVDSLIIHWPSGLVTVLTNVAPDQLLAIQETLMAHDIAALQIVSPKSMEAAGAVIPLVVIKNLGQNTERDVKVTCQVDSLGTIVYTDTQRIALLLSCETAPVSFAPWFLTKGKEYTIQFSTSLPGDLNPKNDQLTRRVLALLDHDIMMRSIVSPFPTIYADEVVPIAVIQNIGSSNEFQFEVTCEVYDNQSLVYRGAQTVIQLASLDTLPIRFGAWKASGSGPFLFKFFSRLPDDENPGNDMLTIVVYFEMSNVHPIDAGSSLPEKFLLSNNYPNPFNGLINIEYHVPDVADVSIDIYNLLGRHIKTLAEREHQPGIHFITWDASDESGNRMASGVYIVRMKAENFEQMRKIVYLK